MPRSRTDVSGAGIGFDASRGGVFRSIAAGLSPAAQPSRTDASAHENGRGADAGISRCSVGTPAASARAGKKAAPRDFGWPLSASLTLSLQKPAAREPLEEQTAKQRCGGEPEQIGLVEKRR